MNRRHLTKPQAEQDISIPVGRSGDWMPAEELRQAALAALAEGRDVTLNLDGVNHLDASALQVLLAFDAESGKSGRCLHLANASPELGKWFEYSGTAEHFFPDGAGRR